MRKFIRKTVSVLIGLAALTAGMAPADAYYVETYRNAQGYDVGWYYYCDDGSFWFSMGEQGPTSYFSYFPHEFGVDPWC